MTAIDHTSNIPPAIDTLERLTFWGLLALFDLNRGTTYKEASGNAVDSGLAPLVDISIVSTADGNQRAICRASFELDPAYTTDTSQKLWQFARAISAAQLPTGYTGD